MLNARNMLRIASLFGFLGVGLGAIGTHAFRTLLETNGRSATYETAVQYHLVHALALLAVVWLIKQTDAPLARWAGVCFSVGIVLFSGSLYAYALSNVTLFAMIAPLGGFAFLAGWACLFGVGWHGNGLS